MAVKTTKRAAPAAKDVLPDQVLRDLTQVFRLVGDETRLRILFYLAQFGELHVTDICERLDQSQPAVSHHLALLRVSGLVEARREGKHNFYSIRAEAFGGLLESIFMVWGEVPKKVKLDAFTLTYSGS